MGRDLLQDLTFGMRTLARRPAFAGTAVLILGLGIGAPTTVLTLVNRIFFDRPPEVTEPHRIFRAFRSWAPGEGGGSMQHADYLYYRENASTLSGLAAYGGSTVGAFSTGGSEPTQLRGGFVSDNYFDVLGVRPAQGRFFLLEENAEPDARPVMVLSDAFWKRALGGDPGVVGGSVLVNGITFTVVGVAPAAFRGVSPVEAAPDAWFPIAMFGALNRFPDAAWWERLPGARSNWLTLVGRLAPGVTFEAADANLTALSDALSYDGRSEQEGIIVVRDYLYRPSQADTLEILSTLLLAVVGLVLAIAAANVTVLLLSRATSRTAEMGIRTAMGAGRSRLFRQLLTESLLLGLAGGAVGIGLAYLFSDAAASLLPFRFITDFRPDASVLGAAVGISVVASFLVGLAPALQASRTDVARTIQGVGAAARRSRLRGVLVVGQVALSLVLVSGALLFARSFNAARTFELGWEANDRLVVQVNLRGQGYSEEEGLAFIPRARERLAALPGVEAATTSRMIPFQGDWSTNIEPPAGAMPNSEDGTVWIGMNVVHPGYFELMGIPLVRGQPLGMSARQEGPPAVVMNETLAETLFVGADPVGQILTLGGDRAFTVVGVARDAVYYELGEEPTTQLYGSVLQIYQPTVHFVLETMSDAAAMAPAAQAALRELDPNLVFPFVTTLASVVDDQTARYRVSAVLVGVFSALALLLAVVGLYGVVSFVVAMRTPEIGVRMALGADRTRIAREVLQHALELAGAGLVLGLIGVLLGRRVTSALLFGTVAADDPLPLVMGILVLAAAVSAASLVPVRRATRVDPVDAIRSE
jgi:predicted permease